MPSSGAIYISSLPFAGAATQRIYEQIFASPHTTWEAETVLSTANIKTELYFYISSRERLVGATRRRPPNAETFRMPLAGSLFFWAGLSLGMDRGFIRVGKKDTKQQQTHAVGRLEKV